MSLSQRFLWNEKKWWNSGRKMIAVVINWIITKGDVFWLWKRFSPIRRLVAMDLETCIGILISWPFFAIPTILLERLCSCYFPFLLSAKFYYRVRSKKLRGILISPRRTRSKDSETAQEDRNKLPLLGCVYCIVVFLWLLSELIIVLLFLILNISKSNFVLSPFMYR